MTQKSVEITRKGAQHSFSHPDCDRRYRNFTGSCGKSRLRTVTAGGELRPASKTDDSVDGMIILRAAQKSTGNFLLKGKFRINLKDAGKIPNVNSDS